jgi:prepilin-type N-terminal cleavage/methylation domain-containing protein
MEKNMEKKIPIKHIFKKDRKEAFTLIELLVVIAIIACLMAIVMVSLNQSKAKSRDAKRATDIQQIAQALALYHNIYQQYPCSASGCVNSEVAISGSDNLSVALRTEKLISTVPLDPLNNETYKFWYRSAGPDYTLRYCQETNSIKRLTQDCNNIISP